MSLELLTISFDDHNANKDFERSLKHSGFAVIKDHRISPKLIDSVYSEWKDFFNNPKKNDFIFIPVGTTHRIENLYKKPVKIMEAQTGPILKETDIIRYKDVYGRVK